MQSVGCLENERSRIIGAMDPKLATDYNDFFKMAAQFGVVGLVAFLLGNRFLKQSDEREKRLTAQADEDRNWIRGHGENQMVLLQAINETNKQLANTNSDLSKTNAELVKMLRASK